MAKEPDIDALIQRISQRLDLLGAELLLLREVKPYDPSHAQLEEMICITEKLHQALSIARAVEHYSLYAADLVVNDIT